MIEHNWIQGLKIHGFDDIINFHQFSFSLSLISLFLFRSLSSFQFLFLLLTSSKHVCSASLFKTSLAFCSHYCSCFLFTFHPLNTAWQLPPKSGLRVRACPIVWFCWPCGYLMSSLLYLLKYSESCCYFLRSHCSSPLAAGVLDSGIETSAVAFTVSLGQIT